MEDVAIRQFLVMLSQLVLSLTHAFSNPEKTLLLLNSFFFFPPLVPVLWPSFNFYRIYNSILYSIV